MGGSLGRRAPGRMTALIGGAALAIIATAAYAAREADENATITWGMVTSQIEAKAEPDRRIAASLDTWRRLASTDNAGFAAYSGFLLENPDWPEETRIRGLAERSADPDRDGASNVAAFFARFPPRTAQGKAVNALALASLGRADAAQTAARDAWTSGVISIDLEQRLLARFGANLTPSDHLRHVDAALWHHNTDAAERMLAYVPPTRQAVVLARIAFQRKAPDAADKMGAADPVGVMDAGYVADKARWLAASGDDAGARQLLAERLPLSQTPADPEDWYEAMLAQARGAAKDGQWALAYRIASRVDDAYAPGTVITDQSLGERDDYTSLTWLAGSAALNQLGRPTDAEAMFVRYANGGRSGAVTSKGYYWAGRAALAAKRSQEARQYFTLAAAFPEQYYGQLALERRGQPIPAPGGSGSAKSVEPTDAERAAFAARPVVRAAQWLGSQGQWADQSKFMRAIAAQAQTDKEHMLVVELSRTLGRPDLGVMAGRRATASGLSGYDRASFPRMKLSDAEASNWTMIHAIARQESQFDRAIVSYAGARGLMQLMPATAREQAGKNGVAFDNGALFDPDYNIALGSAYFRRLLNYYNGSYPLAVAAYNAGMGNVNKWIKANGDPRLPGGDIVQWVEDIPIYQTKDYVQRVLENAVVYDLVNPTGTVAASKTPLSRYLGKADPG